MSSLCKTDSFKKVYAIILLLAIEGLGKPWEKKTDKMIKKLIKKKWSWYETERLLCGKWLTLHKSSNNQALQGKFVHVLFFPLYKTNIFHLVLCLFSGRSQEASKRVENIIDTLLWLVCLFFVLTRFLHHLWSNITEETTLGALTPVASAFSQRHVLLLPSLKHLIHFPHPMHQTWENPLIPSRASTDVWEYKIYL